MSLIEKNPPKKTVVFSLSIIILLLFSLSAYGAPKIVVTPEEFRFGEITEGEKVTHKFIIENKGDSDLIINDLKPGWGCTAALLSSRTIPPNKTGIVEASFNSKNFRGSVVKTVDIYSNDPSIPIKTVRLSGTVKPLPAPELSIVPPIVNLGNIRRSESISREFELINSGELDLSVTEILNTPNCRTELVMSENEKIEIPESENRPITLVITPKGKKILKVICRTDVVKGQFSGKITIKSNARRIPIYILPITGFIEREKP